MTDLTHSPLRRTGRAARRARSQLSMDGVIAAYVREIATHQVSRERGTPVQGAGVPSRPQPRVQTERGTARRCKT